MEPLYLSDGTSLTTQKWNEQRKIILRDALTQHLYPLFQNEVGIILCFLRICIHTCFPIQLRQKLKEEAEERVMEQASRKIFNSLMRRPFTRKRSELRDSSPTRKSRDDDSIFSTLLPRQLRCALTFDSSKEGQEGEHTGIGSELGGRRRTNHGSHAGS